MLHSNLRIARAAALTVFALTAGASLGGCSAETGTTVTDAEGVESLEFALLPAGCTALGATINSHTCSHGQYGPYGSVTASSNPNFSGSSPNFSGIHRYFTVTLPYNSGLGKYVGTVKFTPANDDDHAIYVHPSVTVSVKNKSGTVVSSQLTSTFSGCSYLSGYAVHELKKSTSFAPYRITLEATTATVYVALEEIKPMRERWYPDVDGDTWGPLSPSELTACTPSAGFVTKQSGDCNDNNASIYPGNGC